MMLIWRTMPHGLPDFPGGDGCIGKNSEKKYVLFSTNRKENLKISVFSQISKLFGKKAHLRIIFPNFGENDFSQCVCNNIGRLLTVNIKVQQPSTGMLDRTHIFLQYITV